MAARSGPNNPDERKLDEKSATTSRQDTDACQTDVPVGASSIKRTIGKPCAGNPHARFKRGLCPLAGDLSLTKGQSLPMIAKRRLVWLATACALSVVTTRAHAKPPAPILIVADEIPAMETLAKQLEARAHIKSEIVTQDKLPTNLAPYPTVIVYIHKDLAEATETALLDHASAGARLVLLHHSISSGKRKNKRWFAELGVELPTGDLAAGGYKFYDDVSWDVVNVAPRHPVTTRALKYPVTVTYASGGKRPGFRLEPTEVYLNHVLSGPRTLLLGLRYEHKETAKVYTQDIAGWVKPLGKGRVFYFMPGHKPSDFDNPTYAQILTNAVTSR